MKTLIKIRYWFLGVALACFTISHAQLESGVYFATEMKEGNTVSHELKVDSEYIIHTVYQQSPADFIKTMGGFYKLENGSIAIQLEFNSNFENDGIKTLSIPYKSEGDEIRLEFETPLSLKKSSALTQALDGKWLFATRGPDEGQERRGEANARKTMKFLMDGRFQWIAYQTETFRFSGTGGGRYTTKDGVYTEYIEYFSRDNNRVGAELSFMFNIQGDDWHHQGKNSRGEPMYEIWSRRK